MDKNPLNLEENDNKIKLYNLLVDQIQKYNTIIWQVPTALVAANFFALDKFLGNPTLLLVLSIFNAVLIYAYHRMIIQQRAIINASQNAEDELKKVYQTFIPEFHRAGIRAPSLLAYSLWVIDFYLFVYAVIQLFCNKMGRFY